MESRVAFGTERALGAIFFAKGGFDTWDDYLLFTEAQDVGNITLDSAREYSHLVEKIHDKTIRTLDNYIGGIKQMRKIIRQTNLARIEPSLLNATMWSSNMTLYLDALLLMQVKEDVASLHMVKVVHVYWFSPSLGLLT